MKKSFSKSENTLIKSVSRAKIERKKKIDKSSSVEIHALTGEIADSILPGSQKAGDSCLWRRP